MFEGPLTRNAAAFLAEGCGGPHAPLDRVAHFHAVTELRERGLIDWERVYGMLEMVVTTAGHDYHNRY